MVGRLCFLPTPHLASSSHRCPQSDETIAVSPAPFIFLIFDPPPAVLTVSHARHPSRTYLFLLSLSGYPDLLHSLPGTASSS